MSDFSDRLKAALEKSGKSQRQVAEEIGATGTSISRYVNGENVNSTKTCRCPWSIRRVVADRSRTVQYSHRDDH